MTTFLDTRRRKLFEFRFERLAPGRTSWDLLKWQAESAELQASYGVPQPLSRWSQRAGARGPAVISLYEWSSLNERQGSLGRFLATEEAAQRLWRGAQDGLVRDAQSWLLIDSPPARNLVSVSRPEVSGVHEMRIHKVLNNSVSEAAQSLVDHELSTAVRQGAKLSGLYELAIGPDRPIVVAILAWPKDVWPGDVWIDLDASPHTWERRLQERSRHRRRLFAQVEQILLEPVERPGSVPLLPEAAYVA